MNKPLHKFEISNFSLHILLFGLEIAIILFMSSIISVFFDIHYGGNGTLLFLADDMSSVALKVITVTIITGLTTDLIIKRNFE